MINTRARSLFSYIENLPKISEIDTETIVGFWISKSGAKVNVAYMRDIVAGWQQFNAYN